MRPKRTLQERPQKWGFFRAVQPADKFTGRANCIQVRQIARGCAVFRGVAHFCALRKSGAFSERCNCKPAQIVTRRPLDEATYSRWPSIGERGPHRCRENSFRQEQIRPVQSARCTWSPAGDAFSALLGHFFPHRNTEMHLVSDTSGSTWNQMPSPYCRP